MSATELLPCPFCGSEAKLIEGEECAYVQCLQVKCHRGPFVDGDNAAADEAVDEWNRRTDLSQSSVAAALEAAANKLSREWPGPAVDIVRALITPAQRTALQAAIDAAKAEARAEDAGMIYHAWCMGRDAAATAAHTAKPLNYAQLTAVGSIKAPQQVFSQIGAKP